MSGSISSIMDEIHNDSAPLNLSGDDKASSKSGMSEKELEEHGQWLVDILRKAV